MDPYVVVVTALWAMLPAYLPNSAAVLGGGGRPLDLGYSLWGRRLLGDGKSLRGTLVGWAAGAGLALVLNALVPTAEDLLGVAVPEFPLAVVLFFPLGAMLGDIAASFLKRRLDRKRGAPLPVVDQLDFVVGSLPLAYLAAPEWFQDTFTGPVLLVVVVVTPVIHLAANRLAYELGLKDQPW